MIFDNEFYNNNQKILLLNYVVKNNSISKLEMSNRINIPYATFYRLMNNGFSSRPNILDKLINIYNIEIINNTEELNYRADEFFLNYLFRCENTIEFKNNNSIEIIQNLVFRLIKSDMSDLDAYNKLKAVKEHLSPIHRLFYDLMDKIIRNEPIIISRTNNMIESYFLYIRLKNYFKNGDYISFILNKDEVKNVLSGNLLFNMLLEVKIFEMATLIKLNVIGFDNLMQFKKINLYSNEINVLKCIIALKENKIEDALYYILKIEALDRNLLLALINKKTRYYVDDLKKYKKDNKSLLYEYIRSYDFL